MATDNANVVRAAHRVGLTLVAVGADSPQSGARLRFLAGALRTTGFSVSQFSVADAAGISNAVGSIQPPSAQRAGEAQDSASIKPPTLLAVVCRIDAIPGQQSVDDGASDPALTATTHTARSTHIAELTDHTVAAVQRTGTAVVVAHAVSADARRQHSQPGKAGGKNTAKVQTITVRDVYREHDSALLIRQLLSLLNIEPAETSAYHAYPVPPLSLSGAIALDPQQLRQQMNGALAKWAVQKMELTAGQQATELTRELRFTSFQAAIQFMHMTAPVCDVANHHPHWENNWRTLRISLTTWDANRQITERDIQLARYFDYVYRVFGFDTSR